MDMLLSLDIMALILNIALLYIFGQYDKKLRALPFLPFLGYLTLSASVLIYRNYLADSHTKQVIIISLIVTGGLLAGLIPLATINNMLGVGDILLVLASGLLVPYPPLGLKIRSIPILTPLAVIISILLIYYIRRKITVYIPDFPPGYRRVIKVRARWLKKQEVVKAYPVYIPGYGFVYEEIFKADDPREATKKLVSSLRDDEPIYVLPNFPFVYYYFLAFMIVSVAFVTGGLIELILAG